MVLALAVLVPAVGTRAAVLPVHCKPSLVVLRVLLVGEKHGDGHLWVSTLGIAFCTALARHAKGEGHEVNTLVHNQILHVLDGCVGGHIHAIHCIKFAVITLAPQLQAVGRRGKVLEAFDALGDGSSGNGRSLRRSLRR